MSLSRFVAALIHDQMARDDGYERARRSYLALAPADISSGSARYPSRDELYRR